MEVMKPSCAPVASSAARRLATSSATASWPVYVTGATAVGNGLGSPPWNTPLVGSAYASSNRARSRRRPNPVTFTSPGPDCTSLKIQLAPSRSSRPPRRWNEYDHQAP
jgi:hypothetical protein